jgi:hypothetical protein
MSRETLKEGCTLGWLNQGPREAHYSSFYFLASIIELLNSYGETIINQLSYI